MAAALAVATLALSACGAGFGAGSEEGEAELTVSRDYGRQLILEQTVGPLSRSSTAMRLLDGAAEVETSYGGGFVDSIEGISSASGSRNSDWFYFVNGVAAESGAAEFLIEAQDQIWWDYRDWTDAMEVNAVVGSFPAPLSGGFEAQEWPVSLVCLDVAETCRIARNRLEESGVDPLPGEPSPGSLRVLIGTWEAVGRDTEAGRLDSGPSVSGVFAGFSGGPGSTTMVGFDRNARPAVRFGAGTGLVAALRRGQGPPLWLVTGTDAGGVEAAARALTADDLRNRYAAAVTSRGVVSLPASVPGEYETGVGSQE